MNLYRIYNIGVALCIAVSVYAYTPTSLYTTSSARYSVYHIPTQVEIIQGFRINQTHQQRRTTTIDNRLPQYTMQSTSRVLAVGTNHMHNVTTFQVSADNVESQVLNDESFGRRPQHMPPPTVWVPIGDGVGELLLICLLSMLYTFVRVHRVRTTE